MCATLALNLSKSAGRALLGYGSFGLFDEEVTFEVRWSFLAMRAAGLLFKQSIVGLLQVLLACGGFGLCDEEMTFEAKRSFQH